MNPLIYGFMSKNFRDSFTSDLASCFGLRACASAAFSGATGGHGGGQGGRNGQGGRHSSHPMLSVKVKQQNASIRTELCAAAGGNDQENNHEEDGEDGDVMPRLEASVRGSKAWKQQQKRDAMANSSNFNSHVT